MPGTERLYVGIGIRMYDDPAFCELPKAVDDVRRLGSHLEVQRGYTVETIPNPEEEQVRSALKRILERDSLPKGSALVLLWCGHGELLPDALNLVAKNTRRAAAPELTPEYISGILARCGASQILLLLDTCYSGAGVFDAQKVVDLVQRERSDTRAWFGVLASTLDYGRAKDGVFVDHLLTLLRSGPTDPILQRRWSAHNQGVRGDDVMDVMVKEWQEPGQALKAATLGSAWPMFPNPQFDLDAPERVVEHLLLAAEGRAPDEEGVYFTGRKTQLDELVAWIQTGKPGVFVVTGPAGCGKSAIAGRIVSLSNPEQRARLLESGSLEHADPGQNSVDAHVHTRGLTVDQLVEEIDEQLVRHGILPPRAGEGSRNRGDLLGDLERIDYVPLIVLDGLDEAGAEAWAIARDLVGLLARAARLVVATRQLPPKGQGEPDLLQALSAHRTIDLGEESVAEATRLDVIAYVHKRLAGVDPKRMDVTKVAEAIVRLSN